MPVSPTSVIVEMEFTPSVWTDVSKDVHFAFGLRLAYGVRDPSPRIVVAATGFMSWWMKNGTNTSAKLQGLYSPNHVNVRAGFGFGTGVRLLITFAGITYYKFRGKLTEIDPVPGLRREQRTRCVATDWIDDLAVFRLRDVGIQLNKRPDELLTTIINSMPADSQPIAQSLDVGLDTYATAFYDLGPSTFGRTIAVKVVRSELGMLAVIGDTTEGGLLRFFNRHHFAKQTSAVTLDDTMNGVTVPTTLDLTFNRLLTKIHPTRIDAAATTVVWSMSVQPSSIQQVVIAGEAKIFWGTFFNPANENQLIGVTEGEAPDPLEPDFQMNATQGGGGADLTGSFTVVATFFATTVKFTVTNNGTVDGFITLLQVRGKGIFNVSPLSYEAVSVQDYGQRTLRMDMPYQDDPIVGQGVADYLESIWSVFSNQITTVLLSANKSDVLMTQSLAREPGDRVTISETVTGLSLVPSIVRGVEMMIKPGNLIKTMWHVSPAAAVDFWILDDPVASLLGISTVLGYV